MSRAWFALFLLLPGVLNASELALKRRYGHPLDGIGWSVFAHGSQVVALNRKTLKVEVLDAATGKTKLVDTLDSEGSEPRLLETLSDSKGEFLVTLVREDGVVELHAINNDVSWEVKAAGQPLSLQLVEGRNAEVYLVVATRSEIGVYRRAGKDLKTVRVIKSKVGNKQVQAMRSNTGLIVLSIFDRDNQIHGIQLDAAGGPHEHVMLGRPTVARAQAQVDGRTNDYVTALMSRGEFRFYVEGEKDDSDAFPMDSRLFAGQWIKGTMGHSLWASAHSGDNGGVELSINDPYLLSEPVNIGVGPAEKISDVGTFNMRVKPFYFFVQDHTTLHIHSESEEAARVSAKDGGQIVNVQVVAAAKGLLMQTESADGINTTLQMIGLQQKESNLKMRQASHSQKAGNLAASK